MEVKYVSKDTALLFAEVTGKKVVIELLWGDRLELLDTTGSRVQVKARGKKGFLDPDAIGEESLLEVYFIDVGQGDGILIRTPDDRHIMIDGGYDRSKQPTGKNAADFVDWKFNVDYGRDEIHIDTMIASHNDADHYGGLSDLLDVSQNEELDAQAVTVNTFFHAGVGWWINPANGQRWLGPTTADKKFLIQLMGNREEVEAALQSDAEPKLQGEWANFMEHVVRTKTNAGLATPIQRLSQVDQHIPGYDGSNNSVSIRVLAPFEKQIGGSPSLHSYGSSNSKNTNGNSILLRLDYGRSRILLTGDLNTDSQRALLDDYAGSRMEFLCDVAKACHHGSDHVSYEFLSAMRPAVTVISSGDNEGHDHPRPSIVAASATTGHLVISQDRIVTPLIYSTELARSISLGRPTKLIVESNGENTAFEKDDLKSVTVEAKVTKAGDIRPTTVSRQLDRTSIVAGLVYGLVNVRTDGVRILCATLNEKDNTWQVRNIVSRF